MTDDPDFNKRKLTGDQAENIVEFLIKTLPDWECCKFGVEHKMRELIERVRHLNNPVAKKIRKSPDFIVFNKKTDETFFLEVKSTNVEERGVYIHNYKMLGDYKEFWKGTKLIMVRKNKPHFAYIDLNKIDDDMKRVFDYKGKKLVKWNFKEIEQEITDLFPELKEEDLEHASKKII